MRRKKMLKRSAYKRIIYAKDVLSEVLDKSFYAGEFGDDPDGFAEFCESLIYNISKISHFPEDVVAMATIIHCGSAIWRFHGVEFLMPETKKCCALYNRTRREVKKGSITVRMYHDNNYEPPYNMPIQIKMYRP